MEISISINTITYNNKEFLFEYFNSIINTNLFQKGSVEINIYDWGSNDGSIPLIEGYILNYTNNVNLFRGNNIGLAKANNFLAEISRGKYLFILNPDTKIEKNTLNILINNSNKEEKILVPLQLTFNKNFLNNGIGMDIFGYASNSGIFSSNSDIFYCDGASIFIKKDLFFNLGMFDPDYFIFYEDIDLSWRAHLFGIGLEKVPEAIVYHFGGGTVKCGMSKNNKYETTIFRRYLSEKNLILNLLKNYSIMNLFWIIPIVMLINTFEMFLFLLVLKPKVSFCYLRAIWWNIKNLKNTLRKRAWVQSNRIISDKLILKKMSWSSAKLKLLFRVGIPKF